MNRTQAKVTKSKADYIADAYADLGTKAQEYFVDPETFLTRFRSDPVNTINRLIDTPDSYGRCRFSGLGKLYQENKRAKLVHAARKIMRLTKPFSEVRATFRPKR